MQQFSSKIKETFQQTSNYYSDKKKEIFDALKSLSLRRFIQEKLGYPLEKHYYKTKDGYINSVYRIPGIKGSQVGQTNHNKPVILYQHGLLDCCASIIYDEEQSLGLKLVNAGYDLWMNNSRGNKYSRDHQYIDIDLCKDDEKQSYWDFSFDQMAQFDQPALWEYVLKETKQEKLIYIGHSQGTAQMFAALCDNGDFFKNKMKIAYMYAPITRIQNMEASMFQKMKSDKTLFKTLKSMGPEIFTTSQEKDFLSAKMSTTDLIDKIDKNLAEQATDSDYTTISKIGRKNQRQFYPAGCSFRQIHHFQQLLLNGGFKKFDYESEEKNMQMYGQLNPPNYDLQHIEGFKIVLICGKQDLLSSVIDYLWCYEQLKTKNQVLLKEYDLGHTGLIYPQNEEYVNEILQHIIQNSD